MVVSWKLLALACGIIGIILFGLGGFSHPIHQDFITWGGITEGIGIIICGIAAVVP